MTKLGRHTAILGYTWLRKHNPQIDWQNKMITMSRCLQQCLTCRTNARNERKTSHVFEARINACRSGPFPTLVEEYDEDEDDDNCEGALNPEEGVPGASQSNPNPYGLHPEDDHDSDVEIEDGRQGPHLFGAHAP